MEAMPQSWNDDRLDDLNVKVDRGFEHVDRRFEHVDRRFEQVDERFAQIDRQFGEVERRFNEVDRRLEEVDKRFDKIDRHAERTQTEFVAVRRDIKESSENTQRMLIQAMAAIVAFMASGFGALIVLIATQL